MTIHFFTKQETKDILSKLKGQFGIESIDGTIARIGQERLFLFRGSLTDKQIQDMEEEIVIERIGVYFAKEQHDGIRLSIEGAHLLKEQITKNIFEINDEQVESWMKGQELNISTGKNGFFIIKNNNDLLGTGKASENKITNFIPKNRRLRERS